MTLDKILGMSADELDKMTPEEWEAFYTPLLPLTRPEMQPLKEQKLRQEVAKIDPRIVAAQKLAQERGISIDMSLFKGLGRKK